MILDMIPLPNVVRQLIAENVREGEILRRLLRVSESAAEYRRWREQQSIARMDHIEAPK